MDIICDTKINSFIHDRVFVYKLLSLYNGCLENSIPIIKQYFILSIYGQKKLLKVSVIQVQSIKLMGVLIQGLVIHRYGVLSQEKRK